MPKTVSSLLSSLFSKSRTGKLVTDAAPLDDVNDKDPSCKKTTSEQTPSASCSPTNWSASPNANSEPSNGTYDGTSELTAANSALSPRHANDSMLTALPTTNNNTVAVNNTQAHNVYQFSQINGLHIGSVFNIANTQEKPTTDKRPKSGEPIRKTKSIDAMMKCNDELTHKTLNIVATHLGEGWRDLMRHLGFSDGQVEQMYEDNYARGLKEVIYQFLLDYSRNDDDASLGHMTRVLWKCGHRECVYILKEHWKNGDTYGDAVNANEANSVKLV